MVAKVFAGDFAGAGSADLEAAGFVSNVCHGGFVYGAGNCFSISWVTGGADLFCAVLAEWAGNACCGMAGQSIGDSAGGSMGAGWTGKAGGLGGGKGVSLRDNIKKVLSTHGAHFKRAKVLQVM